MNATLSCQSQYDLLRHGETYGIRIAVPSTVSFLLASTVDDSTSLKNGVKANRVSNSTASTKKYEV